MFTGECCGWRAGLVACLLAAAASTWADLHWRAPQEVSRGSGERGPWRQNESRYDFVDDPAAAWSPRGELAVAWVDQRRKAVLLQRYSADGKALLSVPVDVSRQPATFSWLPRLAWAPDAAGRLHTLWQEIIFSGGSHGGEILYAASDDGGQSFATPVNLSRSKQGDGKGRINRDVWHNGSLDIVAAPDGGVFAAWTEYDGRLWFTRSRDGGREFSPPLLVAGDPPARPARAPALAVSRSGAVALAWASGDDPAGDIQMALSGDGGHSFEAPRTVAVTPGYSDAPKVAFDGTGMLHVVYAESRGGPFDSSSIRHLRSDNGGRSFGAPREISHPLPPGYAGAAFPALGIDGHGRLVAIWELMRGSPARPYGLAIAIAEDGAHFGAPQLIPGSVDPGGGPNGSTQGLLMSKLAVRADGEIAVVNSAVKVGSHSRVWLLRASLP
ncbi:hypothetical protein UC35_19870 [Ramlibacter tataouinensis]|uniref:Exo-alpha-sialidase n=1 Tax=Ramlibacter tataouinensis TaxID=94132 RepID=A0A140HL65_9BURK|nr:hypothetical protein UC35_19870 [Ramlibacter tataouinensis]